MDPDTAVAPIPAHARLMLEQLRRAHTDDPPAAWGELRAELDRQLDLAAGFGPSRAGVVAAFEQIRDEVLAARVARRAAAAFRSGDAHVVAVDDDGWQCYQFLVDGEEHALWVAPDVLDRSYQRARRSAQSGTCRACRLRFTVLGRELHVLHGRRCPAAAARRSTPV